MIELLAAGALAWHVVRGWRAPLDWWSAAAMILLLLVLALPLVQLVPLPPSWWTALPGRDDVVAGLRVAGLGLPAMPISLQPDDTHRAAAFLIAPAAMFVATLHADWRGRMLFGWVVVGVALAGALLGLLQAGGGAGVYLYDTAHRGAALGFFANKNHHADLLVIGILLAAALTRASGQMGWKAPSMLVAAGMVAVLAVALPATNSRAGLALLPFAVIPAALMLVPAATLRRARARDLAVAIAVIAVIVAIGAGSGTVRHALDRFGGEPDGRWQFWPDVLVALRRYQPIGSGLGSFVRIFQRDESIGTLGITYVNHAHNDYLEIVLEAGWAGAALIAGGVLLLAAAAWRVLRPAARGPFTAIHLACVLGLVALAGHSLLDYPLRTLALSCTLAFLAGCLAPAPIPAEIRQRSPARRPLAKSGFRH
jgi:O-antigen ligase